MLYWRTVRTIEWSWPSVKSVQWSATQRNAKQPFKRYSCPEQVISQLRGVTCHMRSHSVTCHPTQVNTPRLTPARQAGSRLTYPRGMEGWVDLLVGYVPRRFTCQLTVTHPSSNRAQCRATTLIKTNVLPLHQLEPVSGIFSMYDRTTVWQKGSSTSHRMTDSRSSAPFSMNKVDYFSGP